MAENKGPFDQSQIFTIETLETKYQSVAYTDTSGSSTAISADLSAPAYVLLWATTDCHIRSTTGASLAVATDIFLPAFTQTPYVITPGNLISVVRDLASGTLHISPVK